MNVWKRESDGRTRVVAVETRSGAVAVIEVVFTDKDDAKDVIDLAYEKAKRAISRDEGEVEGSSPEVPCSCGDESEWERGLPHA